MIPPYLRDLVILHGLVAPRIPNDFRAAVVIFNDIRLASLISHQVRRFRLLRNQQSHFRVGRFVAWVLIFSAGLVPAFSFDGHYDSPTGCHDGLQTAWRDGLAG